MSDESSKGEEPAARPAEEPAAAPAEEPRCRCGNQIGSREVQLEPVYTGFGMFLFTMGITANPKYAEWKCVRCRQVLGRSYDKAVLSKFD